MTASHLVIALLVALVAGGLATVYLLRVQRSREVTRQGVQTLAAMRWREFSQFVVTALQAQGFEASPLDTSPNARHHADMVLTRGERTWLLSCRQAPDYRVGPQQVEEMTQAVRTRGAAGGVIVTLGRVDPRARREAETVELIDGLALWPLVAPLLPTGLLEHAGERAGAVTRRHVMAAWALALALGVLVAVLPRSTPTSEPQAPVVAPPASAVPAAPATDAPPPAPDRQVPAPAPAAASTATPSSLSDDQQRQTVLDRIRALPGVASVNWSSRSTLQVTAQADAPDLRDPICKVLLDYEQLRASRVQLQATAVTGQPARFFHCAAY